MHTYIHTDCDDCAIIWYPRVGVKHTWQVYVTSEPKKIVLFLYFKHHGMSSHSYGKQVFFDQLY